MTDRLKQRLFAWLAGLGLLGLVLSLIGLVKLTPVEVPEKVVIRQVNLAMTPPPPPPPQMAQSQVADTAQNINLSIDGSGSAVQFDDVKLKLDPKVEQIAPPQQDVLSHNLVADLNVDWRAFGLNDLDGVPRLLTSLKIRFPKTLTKKGIKKIAVEVDVVIDESGKVILRSIVSNPHPEMTSVITNLMKRARFTPPKKDGVAVRAAFNWPLEFANS